MSVWLTLGRLDKTLLVKKLKDRKILPLSLLRFYVGMIFFVLAALVLPSSAFLRQ
jgi:hypothetical protein